MAAQLVGIAVALALVIPVITASKEKSDG